MLAFRWVWFTVLVVVAVVLFIAGFAFSAGPQEIVSGPLIVASAILALAATVALPRSDK